MSKGIFEKNLNAMEKWYPAFVDLIREKKEIKDQIEVIVKTSWDGEKIFQIKKNDRSLYLNGKRNAKKPIEMWIKQLGKIPKNVPVFLFGIGSGMYLKELINNTEKEVNIVVYEPSITIFLKLLHEIDLSHEIENRPIAFVIEELNEEEFEVIMKKVFIFENLAFLKEQIHPNYKEWYSEKIIEKIKLVHRRAEDMMVSYNTGISFSTQLATNVLNNMKYICDGYNTKKLSEAIPYSGAAILVSAGPSLNKNIQELKKAKNKAFILAVDTALKPLLKAQIVPDAYITIDSKKEFHLVDMEGVENIPVIAPTSAYDRIIEYQKGKKIFYNDNYVIPDHVYSMNHKWFPDVSSGGSVACSGFSLLYKMGFNTIILVGQDLAYTDNKSHADGTFQEKMPEEDTEGMIMVKGNYVDKIPTKRVFRIFLEWFEMYIKGAKEHRDIRVINATEGGAFIEGTELSTLKDILEEVCKEEIDFSEKIEHMESAFSEDERRKAIEFLYEIPKQYDDIKQNAKLLNKAYKKIEKNAKSGNIKRENVLRLLKKVKKLEKECRKKHAYQLIDMTMPAAEYIIRSEMYCEEDSIEAELKEIARKGILYSKLLQECAVILKEIAENSLLSIEM